MPPPGCPHCCGKWPATAGGVCTVCRTLDRISAYCRGHQLPPASQEGLLARLRSWLGELQDYSETFRGVVPCASGVPPPDRRVPPPADGEGVPKEEEIEGATPKAPGAPPPPPAVAPKEEAEPEVEGPSASRSSRPAAVERKRSKSPSQHARKRSRKTRSPRRRSRSHRRRLASPVRPEGVRAESPSEDNREELRRRKARPRSPENSPPRERARWDPSGEVLSELGLVNPLLGRAVIITRTREPANASGTGTFGVEPSPRAADARCHRSCGAQLPPRQKQLAEGEKGFVVQVPTLRRTQRGTRYLSLIARPSP